MILSKFQVHKLIKKSIETEKIQITRHAWNRFQERGISIEDLQSSVLKGIVLSEDLFAYPCPTYEIEGKAAQGKRVVSIWGYNIETGYSVCITVYPKKNSMSTCRRR